MPTPDSPRLACPDPRRRALLAMSLCLLDRSVFAASAAPDAIASDGRPLTIATSTPGGGFALYGETLARVLDRRAGSPFVRTRLTQGTAENLTLLARDEVDAALIQGTSAGEILQHPDADGLRVLYAMYPSPGMLAVPSASPIVRLEDAVGRRVVFGVRASGLVTLGRQVFAGIDIDIDRDLQALYVQQASEAPGIVLAGDAVGLWGAGEGWPGFERLARSPGGARFIGPSAAQVARIVARYPLLKAMEVGRDAYPGIDRPLATVGSMNLILASRRLDERRAARFVAAMDDAVDDLAAALPQAKDSTLANTIASAPTAALHPAVLSLDRRGAAAR